MPALRRLEAALVVGASLLSLVFYARLPSTMPSEDDYRAAAAEVAGLQRPGDAVLVDPHWAQRTRLFVTGMPVLDLGRRPARQDLARFDRLFVVRLARVPPSEPRDVSGFLEASRFRPVDGPRPFGALEVQLFENSKVERPSYDFVSQVASARVYIRRPDGSEERCPSVGNRHPCPRAGWINVGEELKEIAFKPQRCLWAHPAGREPLVIEYADVPLASELRVMGGIVGQIVFRTERYTATRLEVKIDGQLMAQLELAPGVPGEKYRVIDTSALAGGRHTVQFEVTAENPDMRHLCFDAGVF